MPGMDGTGRLFRWLVPHLEEPIVASYPPDEELGYHELLERLDATISRDRPLVLVGESFSGPLALRLARRPGRTITAVVLVASFVRCPSRLLSALSFLVVPHLFRTAPPTFLLRRFLTGRDAPPEVVTELLAALAQVSPAVFAHRLREIATVDAREDLRLCPAPVVYLQGDRDRLVLAHVLRELRAIRPDMTHHQIHAPHFVAQRAPLEVARIIVAR